MSKGMNRRDFLKRVGAGAAVVSLPGLVSGCSPTRGAVKPSGTTSAHTTYFDQFGVDTGMIQRVIARGLARGGDFSEIFLQHEVSHGLGMQDGAVNQAYSKVDLGAGVRVLKGDATGFAYCEDLTEDALTAAAATAAAIADKGPVLQPKPVAAHKVENHYQVEVPWTEVGIDKKLPIVEKADKRARARDKRIIKVVVFLSDSTSRVLVANSDGLLVEDDRPMALLVASCVAMHNGKVETGYKFASSRNGLSFFSEKLIDKVAHEAADHTVMLFDAVAAPVGELPVVMAPGTSGILLHEAMGHGFEADFNRKGVSIYADMMNKRIGPEFVTIYDDGTNERMRGSINVDDEGAAGQKTALVEKGVLRSYLHDRISANHYKVKPTGNGRRQSFRFPPVPRMRNTYMGAGPHDPQEIVASVKKGLYAEEFTNGQVQIGAGDFTFYLKHGRLIEDGKLKGVVKDANLIGSGPKVLEAVQMVGSDLVLSSGGGTCGKDGQGVPVGFGLPTIKAGAISIGGRKS